MSDKKKKATTLVRLVSAVETGFFYVVKKTKRLHTNNIKLEFQKYDPCESPLFVHRGEDEVSTMAAGRHVGSQLLLCVFGLLMFLFCHKEHFFWWFE